MKRISTIIMALVMVITMAQCKKDNPTTPDGQDNVVTITLDVKGASTGSATSGSKVVVNPATGTVDFETGDKVYVGSGGKYVGFLTHNGTNFVGNITNPTENQPLQFYFLGNVTPTETLSAGTTEECSVIISDQTEHLPVISYAASYENYVSGLTSYTSHLLNKCALVKFNVTTPSNSPICITGMHNKVTVDFSQNTVTPSVDGDGVIMLPAGSGENVEKWAILLPQEALEEGLEGSIFTYDETYRGERPAIPIISNNGYLADGINLAIITDNSVPIGAISGLFSIDCEGNQVYFSQGNLQYQASTSTWRFAVNQWNYVGGFDMYNPGSDFGNVYENGIKCSNSSISSTYDGWIDLFGWGTGNNPSNSSTNNSDYSSFTDWGYNSIFNGGGQVNSGWRTLAAQEWDYVFNARNTISGVRYARGNVNGTNGIILLPDDWDISYFPLNSPNNGDYNSNIITANDWMNLLQHNGAIFLPASGYRDGYLVFWSESDGCYWSATYDSTYGVYHAIFSEDQIFGGCGFGRFYGRSVRLVQDY